MDRTTLEAATRASESAADAAGITGPARTPWLLDDLARRTEGGSLRANLALLIANTRLATEIAVADAARSKVFYQQCLAPLELELVVEIEGWCGFGQGAKAEFWFGEDEYAHRPMHIAFRAANRDSVDRFYQAGIAAGGRDNGAPGLREQRGREDAVD